MPCTFTEAQDAVAALVKQYRTNEAAYRAAGYKEAHARQDLIDPMLMALGWDVRNSAHAAPNRREVIPEASLDVEGARKAPDYAFRFGADTVFYVEAKKPGVTIKTAEAAAFQLRRYAWSAKLPLSILTDFEEFAVYDCFLRPSEKDKASIARINYYTYDQYPDTWRQIWDVFSREAVYAGSFDQYAQTAKGKRGTTPVDAEFLKEIEGWRDVLARNLALRNNNLSIEELNDAVQRTIDRLIFLRMAEDRGIEPYGRLQQLAAGENVYAGLIDLCRKADAKYNSGLFDLSAKGDRLTTKLAVDDKTLQTLLSSLYFPNPYEFSVMPAEILGSVYEQFLGKVIRLTPAHQAKVEEKPEVKKAGGVYYTPSYIVDYVVRQTVGRAIEEKSPKQLTGFRVLDMACGSGSFLLGAYQFLLDHYLKWYVDHSPEKQPKSVGRIRGEWRLTIDEKKRILTEHIFGVDIDRQAVEVTKLSLLLKVLEGENEESLQMRLFTSERALPNLDANIKCGNSLIGPDYFAGQLVPNEDDLRRINPFDWKQEFPEAMKSGGFDIVIGNPPYIRSQTLESEQRAYFGHKYLTATGTYDIYVLFVERALELIDANGKTGFILPNKFFTTDYGEGLRKILGSKKLVERIVDFEDAQVFKGAGTYTTLVFLSHVENISPEYARLGEVYRSAGSVGLIRALSSEIPFAPIALTEDGSRWTLAAGKSGKVLLRIQKKFPSFLTIKPHIFQGLKTSADKIFLLKIEKGDQGSCRVRNDLDEQFNIEHGILMPVLKGERVSRYYLDQSENLYILYPYQIDEDGKSVLIDQSEMAKKFPKTWDYLNRHRKELGERDGGKWAKRPDWYAYARGQNIGTFLGRKILVPYMTKRLRVAPDNEGRLFFVNITTGGYGLRLGDDIYSENYIVGLLNSKLLDHCIQQMTNQFRGGYFAVNKQALERLPFRPIDFANFDEKSSYKRMVDLVDNMLQLHPRLASAKTDHERELIQRQIDATDREIDALVYKLYGLNEKEINIIENQD